MERVEAGIVLTGTEVKSLRNGRANLEDAYAEVDGSEVWLKGCDIPEYVQGNRENHLPKRTRKLLLHRREIAKLEAKTGEKGITLVPLSIYFKKGLAKVEISLRAGARPSTSGRRSRNRTPSAISTAPCVGVELTCGHPPDDPRRVSPPGLRAREPLMRPNRRDWLRMMLAGAVAGEAAGRHRACAMPPRLRRL